MIPAQTDGDLFSLTIGRGPLVAAGGSPAFLSLGREEQAGQLSSHLQPLLILEPSGLMHTGETRPHSLPRTHDIPRTHPLTRTHIITRMHTRTHIQTHKHTHRHTHTHTRIHTH